MSIFVTRSFLPPYEEYNEAIKKIWESKILTNNGEFVVELEKRLSKFLQVNNLYYVSNGTIALQISLKALDITEGEIITTPFSYVATTSSILWERCKPVFVDIEENNFTLDYTKIEKAITPNTKAIMAVHVFGYACNVDEIQKIADKYNLKVIYDAAHAFACNYNGKSLLSYGDISTLSFHATKLFHTIEGGGVIVNDCKIAEKIKLIRSFGHIGDDHFSLGINAKNSEFHAAMGLANFPYIQNNITARKKISTLYDSLLKNHLTLPLKQDNLEYNYSYYPVLFKDEAQLLKVFSALNKQNIYPRRYFYPSLNTLPYIKYTSCPISENISLRIACLPLYPELELEHVHKIANIIISNL